MSANNWFGPLKNAIGKSFIFGCRKVRPLQRRWRQIRYNTNCMIDTQVIITAPDNFYVGKLCSLYHGTYILNDFATVRLGRNSHLGAFCFINAFSASVLIGNDVAIGPGTRLIAYSNYYAKGRKVTDERIAQDIVIGNNVFIGANTVVLPGSIVGDNVVIGANSLVRGTLSSNKIYAGSPCRIIHDSWYE